MAKPKTRPYPKAVEILEARQKAFEFLESNRGVMGVRVPVGKNLVCENPDVGRYRTYLVLEIEP